MLRTARATEAGIVYHVLNRGLSLPFAAPAGLEHCLAISDAPFSLTGHYVIAPKVPMTFERYKALCEQVELLLHNWIR
jgi:hypothetical protein